MVEVTINNKDFDNKLKSVIIEEIIEPITKKLSDNQFNPEWLVACFQRAITARARSNIRHAVYNLFWGNKGQNRLEFELREEITRSIERNLDAFFNRYSNQLQDEFSSRFKELDKTIGLLDNKARKEIIDLQHIHNELQDFGNITFSFVNIPKEDLEKKKIEEAVIHYLRKNNNNLQVCRFNNKKSVSQLLFDWSGQIKNYDINLFANTGKKEFVYLAKVLGFKTKGAPDLIAREGNLVYFIEVKSRGDGIRAHQILWAKHHPEYLVKYVFVNYNGDLEEKAK